MNDMLMSKWFSDPVWETELNLPNEQLIEYAYNLRSTNPGHNKSNRGGWQCSDIVDPPTVYLQLIDHITQSMISVHRSMGLKLDYPSTVQGSWININPPGSYNLRHLHPRSLFSGVYYVQVPDGDAGDLIFYRDNIMLSYLPSYIVNDWNDITSGTATYKVHTGLLLIFPSWVEHSVTPNCTDQDRISISFNSNFDY